MFDTNTRAFAKFVINKRLDMWRLLVTFEDRVSVNGEQIVTVRNAAYASGDLCSTDVDQEVAAAVQKRELERAALALRTSNFVLV